MGAMATSRPLKTVDDYLALGDEVRAELIEGELYMTPSPTSDHQAIAGNLYVLLRAAVRAGAGGIAFQAPLDVRLPTGDIVQPDVMWIADANRSIVQERIHGVPDLVVEVVSPSHAERDRIVKRQLYARSGVPEYWIVDGATRTIERLILASAAYTPAGYYAAPDALVCDRLAAVPIPLLEVFENT